MWLNTTIVSIPIKPSTDSAVNLKRLNLKILSWMFCNEPTNDCLLCRSLPVFYKGSLSRLSGGRVGQVTICWRHACFHSCKCSKQGSSIFCKIKTAQQNYMELWSAKICLNFNTNLFATGTEIVALLLGCEDSLVFEQNKERAILLADSHFHYKSRWNTNG